MKVGIDLVEIERIQKAGLRTPALVQKIFTVRERSYAYSKKNPFVSLAAAFAVKEAVKKLDEVFISGIDWQDIELAHDDWRRPAVILHGEALHRARDHQINILDVSISHTNKATVAVVIAGLGKERDW